MKIEEHMTTEIAESLACWRCGKLVRISGSLEHLTGFLENVAPHASSGGTMRPVHSACSTPRCPHGVATADLCWACNPNKQTSQPKAPHIGPFIHVTSTTERDKIIEECALLAECAAPNDGRDHAECPFCACAKDIRALKNAAPLDRLDANARGVFR